MPNGVNCRSSGKRHPLLRTHCCIEDTYPEQTPPVLFYLLHRHSTDSSYDAARQEHRDKPPNTRRARKNDRHLRLLRGSTDEHIAKDAGPIGRPTDPPDRLGAFGSAGR